MEKFRALRLQEDKYVIVLFPLITLALFLGAIVGVWALVAYGLPLLHNLL